METVAFVLEEACPIAISHFVMLVVAGGIVTCFHALSPLMHGPWSSFQQYTPVLISRLWTVSMQYSGAKAQMERMVLGVVPFLVI